MSTLRTMQALRAENKQLHAKLSTRDKHIEQLRNGIHTYTRDGQLWVKVGPRSHMPLLQTLVALDAVKGGVQFSMPMRRALIRIFPYLPGMRCAAKVVSAICEELFHVRLQREPSESWLSDQHLQLMYFNEAFVGLQMALKHQGPYAVHHDGGDINKECGTAIAICAKVSSQRSIMYELRYKRVVQDKAATCALLIVDTLQELRQITYDVLLRALPALIAARSDGDAVDSTAATLAAAAALADTPAQQGAPPLAQDAQAGDAGGGAIAVLARQLSDRLLPAPPAPQALVALGSDNCDTALKVAPELAAQGLLAQTPCVVNCLMHVLNILAKRATAAQNSAALHDAVEGLVLKHAAAGKDLEILQSELSATALPPQTHKQLEAADTQAGASALINLFGMLMAFTGEGHERIYAAYLKAFAATLPKAEQAKLSGLQGSARSYDPFKHSPACVQIAHQILPAAMREMAMTRNGQLQATWLAQKALKACQNPHTIAGLLLMPILDGLLFRPGLDMAAKAPAQSMHIPMRRCRAALMSYLPADSPVRLQAEGADVRRQAASGQPHSAGHSSTTVQQPSSARPPGASIAAALAGDSSGCDAADVQMHHAQQRELQVQPEQQQQCSSTAAIATGGADATRAEQTVPPQRDGMDAVMHATDTAEPPEPTTERSSSLTHSKYANVIPFFAMYTRPGTGNVFGAHGPMPATANIVRETQPDEHLWGMVQQLQTRYNLSTRMPATSTSMQLTAPTNPDCLRERKPAKRGKGKQSAKRARAASTSGHIEQQPRRSQQPRAASPSPAASHAVGLPPLPRRSPHAQKTCNAAASTSKAPSTQAEQVSSAPSTQAEQASNDMRLHLRDWHTLPHKLRCIATLQWLVAASNDEALQAQLLPAGTIAADYAWDRRPFPDSPLWHTTAGPSAMLELMFAQATIAIEHMLHTDTRNKDYLNEYACLGDQSHAALQTMVLVAIANLIEGCIGKNRQAKRSNASGFVETGASHKSLVNNGFNDWVQNDPDAAILFPILIAVAREVRCVICTTSLSSKPPHHEICLDAYLFLHAKSPPCSCCRCICLT